MSVTVNYKNNAIATIADGGTKTLLTSGTWLEDDIEIVDTTSGGGGSAGAISVTEDTDSHGGTVVTITGVDISNDTVTAAHLESGYTAHDAQGNAITGTLVAGGTFTVTPSLVNGEWVVDKTYSQIATAYNSGNTIVIEDFWDSQGEMPITTYCDFDATTNTFTYSVSWFDFEDTGYQYVDTYAMTSSGTTRVDHQQFSAPAILTSKTITSNGTYNPILTDSADGYSSVTVNVPGWTKIAETTYSVNTTATSAGTVATMATGSNALWTSDKWVYVRIRDTAGKRNGYFYGSDQYFYNINPANNVTATSTTTAIRMYIRYTDDAFSVTAATGSSGYGVWADTLYSDGRVRIRRRYNSTNSLTINGTFKVEVYLLDSAGNVSIFT